MPEVPPQRGSQAVVEAWLKTHIQANELIDSHFGLKFETLTESDDGVVSELVDESGEKHVVKSQYVIGCDGGGSRVRRSLGIELIGGPM
jgi:FAD-dependent monooxygenase